MEKGFVYQHMSDSQAGKFIQEHCSQKIMQHTSASNRPLFERLARFCALCRGGLYLDADLVPLVRLEIVFSLQ